MRTMMLTGLLLVVAAFLTVLIGEALDLEVASTALLGITTGAVIALVPHASAGRRLAAFALGVFASLLGYYFRAGVAPDTATGRAVTAALVIALCVGAVALSVGRLPLWSTLLGAGAFCGAFEATYEAAPPRVVENSMGGVTSLALCVAVGFLVGSLVDTTAERASTEPEPVDDSTPADELMEDAK